MNISPRFVLFSLRKLNLLITKLRITESKTQWLVTTLTNSQDIARILKHSKTKKSSGRDGISKEILKCCSPVLEQILAEIFNEMTEFSI